MTDGHQGCCLWIGDLSVWLDENWLRKTFASTKALVSCKVIRHKATQMSRGYGFLLFNSHEAAEQVLQNLNGKPIPGTEQVFRLNWAADGRSNALASTDYSLFVGDLVEEATDYLLQATFRQFYPSVRSAKVMRAPLSGRSRNFGFCRFGDEKERDRALVEMNGHEICGRPVRVSLATAKKTQSPNDPPASSSASPPVGSAEEAAGNATLFVGGLSDAVSEEQIRGMFALFGEIVSIKHLANRKCAFVQFSQSSAAKAAIAVLQDQVVAGVPLRISWGRSASALGSTQRLPAQPGHPHQSMLLPGSVLAAYPQAQTGGLPLFPQVLQTEAAPQRMYQQGYNPYNIDNLSAAAAALSLGGGSNLLQDPSVMFPQPAVHPPQQFHHPSMDNMDAIYQGSYGPPQGAQYPQVRYH